MGILIETKHVSGGSSDIDPEPIDLQNGTAPLQNMLNFLLVKTPELQTLLDGTNPHQYSAERELYTSKDIEVVDTSQV